MVKGTGIDKIGNLFFRFSSFLPHISYTSPFQFLNRNLHHCIAVLFTIIYFILILFYSPQIFWDEAVYAGMARYISSLAEFGFWEHIRPLVLPVLLSILFLLELPFLVYSRIIMLFISLGLIYSIYYFTQSLLDKQTAQLTIAFISFSPLFIFLSTHILTEILAMVFLLFSFFAFFRNNLFFSGMLISLAILSKFTYILFLPFFAILFSYHFLRGSFSFSQAFKMGGGFAIFFIPYLIFNQVSYGFFLTPFIDAKIVITQVVGCNILNYNPWYFYPITLVKEHLFLLGGILLCLPLLKKHRNIILIFFLFLVPFIYLLFLDCRDYRYMFMFLPFAYILASYGITKTFTKRYHSLIVGIVLIISLYQGLAFYLDTHQGLAQAKIYDPTILDQLDASKEVYLTSPFPALYADYNYLLLYYPVYDSNLAKDHIQDLAQNSDYYVIWDFCVGGLTCSPYDLHCIQWSNKLHTHIKEHSEIVFDDSLEVCERRIYHVTS